VRTVSLSLALAFLAFSGVASASVVTFTYNGTVTTGFDATGDFGAPQSSLNGDAFKLVYTFDTTAGTITSTGGLNKLLTFTTGGAGPIVASLTINGGTFNHFANLPNGYAFATSQQLSPGRETSQYAYTYNDNYVLGYALDYITQSYVGMTVDSIGNQLPLSLTSSYTFQLNQGGPVTATGYFEDDYCYIYFLGGTLCQTSPSPFYKNYAYLTPTSVTVSGIGASVPEMPVWAMLCLGLGGLGAQSRYRRRLVRPA